MNARDAVLSRFTGSQKAPPDGAPWMLDLSLWYKWHWRRGALPEPWRALTEAQIAGRLGAPAWIIARPWTVAYADVKVTTDERESERIVRYDTPAGSLTARWTLGPDGDWWQVEFPVKDVDDLRAARAVIAARTYTWDATVAENAVAEANDHGIVALELPMRPYSDLLHTMLGWGEGLMLFAGEQAPILMEMLALLEGQAEQAALRLAGLPGHVLYAPDNLDGQYISPRVFRNYLQESYKRTVAVARQGGRPLVVHIGGPARRLLPLLAESGVDGVQGIAGPPQGDATLVEARDAAGPNLVLWGGIPQDYLVPLHPHADFEAAVRQAMRVTAGDPRAIIGVADRVSADTDPARLETLAAILSQG
jgi:hypothetical protein